MDISIHTPTKGATIYDLFLLNLETYFNPHSHEGSDRILKLVIQLLLYFNPHSHEGSDEYLGIRSRMMHGFQSTLPRRERLILTHYLCIFFNFNPHSHEGSDYCDIGSEGKIYEFQSTLPRRERRNG